MQFFWKALLVIIPLGGYWLYKRSQNSTVESGLQSRPAEEKTAPSKQRKKEKNASPKEQEKEAVLPQENKQEEATDEQIIDRLKEIDGVTSRVAENLLKKGITTPKALTDLSKDELLAIKGIGPKRAEKILGAIKNG